jgi:hypothetical protein
VDVKWIKPYKVHGLSCFDCMGVARNQIPVHLVQMRLFVTGPYVVKASMIGPAERWMKELKTIGENYFATFKMLAGPGNEHAEPMEEYKGDDMPLPMYMVHPKSWTRETDKDEAIGYAKVDLRLVVDDKLIGFIRVKGAANLGSHGVALADFEKESLKEIKGSIGFTETDVQDAKFVTEGSQFLADYLYRVHQGLILGEESEIWTAGLQTPQHLYICTAVMPAKTHRRLAWMRVKRTWETVLRSLGREPGCVPLA